ncbi:MAG: hypothetical protein DDT41_01326 [candidate division WS2 bacterium]|nr:hypothetical protein [Candidatus Psychracetigena formicireducens]
MQQIYLPASSKRGCSGVSTCNYILNPGQIIDIANMVNEITGNHNGVELVARRDWDKITQLLTPDSRLYYIGLWEIVVE